LRPKKQIFKTKTEFSANEIIPIIPPPIFKTHTVNVRISRGGFSDDMNVWHKAPKRNTQPYREAIRLEGTWFWSSGVRDKNNNILIPKTLLYKKKEEIL
jgi:hypothetical protein